MVTPHTIPAVTHGRYLIEPPADGKSIGILLGCHGYGEGAEAHLERLQAIPGSERWLLVSVQALHRFYNRRSQDVIASWMTRQDRELAIEDNVRYVLNVVEHVTRETLAVPCVFAGFSQGVAMVFRAACRSSVHVAGVIAVGGDVPPELDRAALQRIPAVLLVKGDRDKWYTEEKWAADQRRLRESGVDHLALSFEGGHEWNAEVSAAAGEFLKKVRSTK